MKRDEFEQQFPRRQPESHVSSIITTALTIEQDTAIEGIVKGNLTVKTGSQAHVSGIVMGNVRVEPGSSLYVDGIVTGGVDVEGGVFAIGWIKGKVNGSDDACVCIDNDRYRQNEVDT